MPYVSRGGFKLKKALDAFKFSPKDRICFDAGASTGGFTDCLLQNGATGLAGSYNPQVDAKAQQMNALMMMMGQNGNNNNSMMNMLPLLNNSNGKINPQMIQMMMMNQMMPNFSSGNNNGY